MRTPTMGEPFTLETLEHDEISRSVQKLASDLLDRFYVDGAGCELDDNEVLACVEASIEDQLREAILRFETPSHVVARFMGRRGVRV